MTDLKTTTKIKEPFKFKRGDSVELFKTDLKENQKFVKNKVFVFQSYLDEPIPVKGDNGKDILCDCLVKVTDEDFSKERIILGKSQNLRHFSWAIDDTHKEKIDTDVVTGTFIVNKNKITFAFDPKDGTEPKVGVAKCNLKEDKFDIRIGMLIAFARAFNDKNLEMLVRIAVVNEKQDIDRLSSIFKILEDVWGANNDK